MTHVGRALDTPIDLARMNAEFVLQDAASPHRRCLLIFRKPDPLAAQVGGLFDSRVLARNRNGAHNLRNRLARWLLMMHDRIDGDTLLITQDLLAEMLGAHRPSIMQAVRELEVADLIERGRRQVTILNREGLKKASCECYQLVRDRIAFHLRKTYP
jgi:hypothetical protein